jgi:ABC-type branched-subunit amino acid transport system substrate-binding protein
LPVTLGKTPGSRLGGLWLSVGFAVAVSVLAAVTIATPRTRTETTLAPGLPSGAAAATNAPPSGALPGSSIAAPGVAPLPRVAAARPGGKTYDCARGQNAGATDVGVEAKEIRFAATVVKTGIAKDFLSDAQWGMEAVRQKVNRAGGICGRIITVAYKDDAWNPDLGQRIIEGFIGEKRYFGLAVNPSSEGLRGPIDNGIIRKNQFPVIGADGQLIDQYSDPWVWPVATSTASVMHVMGRDAFTRGARTFGIVWEKNFRFGVEGHGAFIGAVKRLGGTVNADVALQGGLTDYSNKVNEFIGRCGGRDKLDKCDFIALLLEPATASQWVRNGGLGNGEVRPKVGIGAPQPLFLDSFARDCGKFCANMWVWTSFKPPIPPFLDEDPVATYRSDLAAVSATADANNPHVQGAYVGMLLLVEALRRLGPAPTRQGLKAVLDSLALRTGLAPPLHFRPGNHFAATSAQAFEAIVQSESFASWRYTNSGFIADRDVGRDVPR